MSVAETDLGGAALEAVERAAAAILGIFRERGYGRVDPPIIEPADVFIERSGEEIRRRLFAVSDPAGRELCLRPDLTIPVCRLFLRGGAPAPVRLSYCGPAFRFEPAESGRPSQFLQAGAEAIGHDDREAADAEILSACVAAVDRVGADVGKIEIGDLGLFHGLLDSLPIPEGWRVRLRRHGTRPERLRDAIARLAETGAPDLGSRRRAFLDALALLGDAQAQFFVEEVLNLAEISQSGGGRSPAEIAERFLDQAADAATGGLPAELVDAVEAFFAIKGSPSLALRQLRDLLARAGLTAGAELDRFERRLEQIDRVGIAPDRLLFSTDYRSTLRYYTGFVFRILDPRDCEIAGGGRYDDLLRLLGAPRDLPAVGCALRVEELALLSRPAP